MKKTVFGALALVLMLGLLFAADRLVGLTGIERFQTWLELHPDGFMQNRSGGQAWQEFQGRSITYSFKADRTRLPVDTLAGYRVVLLGDSFAFGLYLNDDETASAAMNRQFGRDTTVVNAGVGGTGTADHVQLLERYGPLWQPDLVLLLLNSDDVDRALAKNLFVKTGDTLIASKRWATTRLQRLFRGHPLHSGLQRHSYAYAALEKLLWNTVFFVDLWETPGAVLRPPDSAFAAGSSYATALEQALLLRMKAASARLGAPFAVAYTGLTPPDSASFYTRQFLADAPAFFREQGIPWRDFTPDWRTPGLKAVRTYTLYPDPHPNAEGAGILGRLMTGWIRSGLTPQGH